MCGFTGFLCAAHPINNIESAIQSMTHSLHHRGPDDGGVWLDNNVGVGLGHRRLAILDLSAQGHQPMLSHDERYVMVYNGEIYNYLDIKEQLIKKGHSFSGHSDTEVMLAAVVEYGLEQTLKLMSGMFAFALWDKQEQVLHLARDRIGEKPLYYGIVNGALVFGSELKSLRGYPGFNNEISRQSLTLLLQYGYIPAPHSIYNHIFKLKPGTYITITKQAIKNLPAPTTYWSAIQVAQAGLSSPLAITDDEAIKRTDKLLHNIIQNRMLSDVPLGAFLSGGIDSSVVTALMQANSNRPIKTFTIGFNEKDYNEAEYAQAVAAHLKTDHTELYVDSTQTLAVIPQLPDIYDEPFADSSAIPTYLVAKLAKEQVTVCLSGDGADELFGGYNRYLLNQNIWNYIALIPYPMRKVIKNLLLYLPTTSWDALLKPMRFPHIGDKIHKGAGLLAMQSSAMLYQYLISQWTNADKVVINSQQQQSDFKPAFNDLPKMKNIETMMLADTLTYLPDDILVKVDRAGMAVSLESRAPYLDHELIEFIWQLPFNMRVRNQEKKWLLKQILAKYVPNNLTDRPKMGFGVPIGSWLRGPLREWAENLLSQDKLEKQGYFNAEIILEKWQEHLSGKRNWQYLLWTVLMFQAWLEKTEQSL